MNELGDDSDDEKRLDRAERLPRRRQKRRPALPKPRRLVRILPILSHRTRVLPGRCCPCLFAI